MVKQICELSATHYEAQEAEAFKQKYIERRDNMSRKRHLKLLDGDTSDSMESEDEKKMHEHIEREEARVNELGNR